MSTKIKTVAFCIEALTVGGAEQMLVAMANQFVARGWQVHMICLTKEGELAANLHDDVKLHVLNKRPGIDPRLPRRLRALLKGISPTAVNSHLWTANLWTRISLFGSHMRVIATEHSRDSWKSSNYRRIDRWLANSTAKLVAVSNDTAAFYINEVRIPDHKVCVINNGVDTKRYAAGDGTELKALWASNNELLIGTVGRMVPAKNHIRLLDMAATLKTQLINFKVVLVGDGELKDDIEAAVEQKQLQDCVILAGARTDIPDVLAAFDVFVLSSDREGHPLTALESQAAGTPVVLTKAGGSADAIAIEGDRHGGFLVDKNHLALADAVVKLVDDKAYLRSMGLFAQEYALANFDMQHMVDQYEVLFLQ